MNGLSVPQIMGRVIVPVLGRLGMDSPSARRLMMGTAIVESRLTYLRQLGGGPALGLWQMEPATHDDIWSNWLVYKDDLARRVELFVGEWPPQKSHHLEFNMHYACAMARVHYYRRPEPLPPAEDVDGLGRYWKQHYNTPLGAGNPEKFGDLLHEAIHEHGV